MLTPPSPYTIRLMQLADLESVKEIDRLSFPTPARRGIFEHELEQNKIAHYQVLSVDSHQIIGFAGYWLMADEVHISTIAVHPDWRGRSLGELLLLNLLQLAYRHPANVATLEVRRSNKTAQRLYHKYQFAVMGERRRYYRDTGEDAIIMTVSALDAPYFQFLEEQRCRLFARLSGEA
jgi:ribosomal-protein-alanine N-acetyltransferase